MDKLITTDNSALYPFTYQGIRVSLEPDGHISTQPSHLMSDGLRKLARTRKPEIVSELQRASNAYALLFVSTGLEHWEADDPRFGYEVELDDVYYRQLSPEYYVWLRQRMTNAQTGYKQGRLSDATYNAMRERFNVIHSWAIVHIGEDALRRAMRTIDVATYVPPSEQTYSAYRQSWADAWAVYEQKQSAVDGSTWPDGEAQRVAEVTFTVEELLLMVGLSTEAVRQIHEVKQVFGGKLVPTNESDHELFPDTPPAVMGPQTQQLALLGSGLTDDDTTKDDGTRAVDPQSQQPQ